MGRGDVPRCTRETAQGIVDLLLDLSGIERVLAPRTPAREELLPKEEPKGPTPRRLSRGRKVNEKVRAFILARRGKKPNDVATEALEDLGVVISGSTVYKVWRELT